MRAPRGLPGLTFLLLVLLPASITRAPTPTDPVLLLREWQALQEGASLGLDVAPNAIAIHRLRLLEWKDPETGTLREEAASALNGGFLFLETLREPAVPGPSPARSRPRFDAYVNRTEWIGGKFMPIVCQLSPRSSLT